MQSIFRPIWQKCNIMWQKCNINACKPLIHKRKNALKSKRQSINSERKIYKIDCWIWQTTIPKPLTNLLKKLNYLAYSSFLVNDLVFD
jgi:hypothetical protein